MKLWGGFFPLEQLRKPDLKKLDQLTRKKDPEKWRLLNSTKISLHFLSLSQTA